MLLGKSSGKGVGQQSIVIKVYQVGPQKIKNLQEKPFSEVIKRRIVRKYLCFCGILLKIIPRRERRFIIGTSAENSSFERLIGP